ncbi:putative membrane protein [Cyclonatronum proteinivorum]|uniref:Putative membrane protein n=1 Tax=Cyclonatronum proteinivorum TaxID=1457365 RepID=A0A345UPR8_9BACT|nr:DoxX family membrane protein [Cyclonatronum proteinivorum]AXJ02470.1 putative membrane protein [Cyclonatronum proteinivorum]
MRVQEVLTRFQNPFRIFFGAGFIVAGLYHFINPDFYYPMMPGWFPAPSALNLAAGAAEVVLGAGLLMSKYARLASYGIIGLMVLFIPAHVYMIQVGGCVSEAVCLPLWAAWVRLVVLHPLIILAAWWAGRSGDG